MLRAQLGRVTRSAELMAGIRTSFSYSLFILCARAADLFKYDVVTYDVQLAVI